MLLLLLDWSAPVQLFKHLRHAEAMSFQDGIRLTEILKILYVHALDQQPQAQR